MKPLIERLRGTGTALVTPFDRAGNVDYPSLKKLVDHQLSGGIDFMVVMGTTGESATLDTDEKTAVLEYIMDLNSARVPIVYGVGGNNTRAVVSSLGKVPNGVDAILSVSPYYNKPTQGGIKAHYEELASSTDLPIILYNVPGRTSSNISAETTLALSEIKNIVAVKEASGDMDQIMEIINSRPEGFLVLSGDDALTYPILALGGDGVVSVVSNAFPGEFTEMVKAGLNGDWAKSKDIHYWIYPIIGKLFAEGNPAGVKAVLKEMGIMDENVRLPLVPVGDGLREELIQMTRKLKSSYPV